MFYCKKLNFIIRFTIMLTHHVSHNFGLIYCKHQWLDETCQRDSCEHSLQDSYRLEARLERQVDSGIVGLSNYVQGDYTSYSIFSCFWDWGYPPYRVRSGVIESWGGDTPHHNQSLKNRLTDLEELDEKKRRAAQHIEAIQRRRKITFGKRNKKRALQKCMMVMIQDVKKLNFPIKFDAVWLGPYIVRETFPNNSLQLETHNGESVPTRTAGSRCKQYRAWRGLADEQDILGANPRWSLQYVVINIRATRVIVWWHGHPRHCLPSISLCNLVVTPCHWLPNHPIMSS